MEAPTLPEEPANPDGAGLEPPLPSPTDPTAPLPTLAGSILDGVASGVWGMTQGAAKSGDLLHTSQFEYKHRPSGAFATSAQPGPQSGGYSGYFFLQQAGGDSLKVDDAMLLKFTRNSAGRLNVRGNGENRYGAFQISGSCEIDGNDLELQRAYTFAPTPKKATPTVRKTSGKDLNRVQAAFRHSQETASDVDGKRSARARKAPSHLRDGSLIDGDLGTTTSAVGGGFASAEALKRCRSILQTLERAVIAQWFSGPVDAIKLGIPHYGSIVDSPMDLGTIKRDLERGLYNDPDAFASDVRLVFRNAMTFNVLPEAQVHEAARELHLKFEDQLKHLWKNLAGGASSGTKARSGGVKREAYVDSGPVFSAPKRARATQGKGSGKKKGSKGAHDDDYGSYTSAPMVPAADLTNMQRQMEQMQATIAALQKQASQTEVQVQMNMELGVGSAAPVSNASRIAKPLTFAEKEGLSDDINALPPDKLAHVVKIVQESMPLTGRHDDDEIEVDIETLDNTTLRHLQKYVKDSLKKKGGGKKKGQQQVGLEPAPELSLASDDRMLTSVALSGSGLGSGLESEEDDDELGYDVL